MLKDANLVYIITPLDLNDNMKSCLSFFFILHCDKYESSYHFYLLLFVNIFVKVFNNFTFHWLNRSIALFDMGIHSISQPSKNIEN